MNYSDPVVIFLDRKPVAKSRNLRGLLTYARTKSRVTRVQLYPNPHNEYNGDYIVDFANGATCRGMFASYNLMVQWFEQRYKGSINRSGNWVKPTIVLR